MDYPFDIFTNMPKYRATVWFLHSLAESDAELTRHIYEREADTRDSFEAIITDELVTFRNIDNQVWFGPISEKIDGSNDTGRRS